MAFLKPKTNRYIYVIMTIMVVPTIGFFGILYISIYQVPVNKENFMLNDYHFVDDNYNEIQLAKVEFEKRFDLNFNFTKFGKDVLTMRPNNEEVYFPYGFQIGENAFSFTLKTKDGKVVNSGVSKILLTRFETNEFNKELKVANIKNGVYTTEKFDITKSGRWKIILSIEVDNFKNIYEYKVFAK